MQNIVQLLIRYGSFVTFVFLELVALYLIVQYNNAQRSIFLNSTKVYHGEFSEAINDYQSYFHLREVNDSLAQHNATLKSKLLNLSSTINNIDTIGRYVVKSANVVGNSYRLRNNHLTIDVGEVDGIKVGQGVIGDKGILGIVRNTSDNYAHVNSILHSQTRLSCTVSPHLIPGNLIWKNSNPRYMHLEAIPKHVPVSKGDTVMTNGFSTIFPKGIAVGTVESYDVMKGSNNYDIKVKLINDVAGSKMAYVIIDKDLEEIQSVIVSDDYEE